MAGFTIETVNETFDLLTRQRDEALGRLQSAQARIAKLEAAIRELARWAGEDSQAMQIARAALKQD